MSDGFPDDTDTSPDWPQWQWGEFRKYIVGLPNPFIVLPGNTFASKEETALNAWNHKASVAGAWVQFHFRIKEMLSDDAFFAARSAMDDYNAQLDTETLRAHQESNMPQLIVPDCFIVAINGVSGGQVVTTVLGVRNAGGTALGAAQAVQAAYKGGSKPLTQKPGQYALTDFRAMDISTADGDIAVVPDTTAGSGSLATNLATNGACALVKWNGGTRSKSSRGRVYHGPLLETWINSDGRTLTTVARDAFDVAYTAMLDSLNTAGYPLVVISRKNSTSHLVTDVQVEGIIATQRRRIR